MEHPLEETAVAVPASSSSSSPKCPLRFEPSRLYWRGVEPLTQRSAVVHLRNVGSTPQRLRLSKDSDDSISVMALGPGLRLSDDDDESLLSSRPRKAPPVKLLDSRLLAPGLAVRLLVKTSTLLNENIKSHVQCRCEDSAAFALPIQATLPVVEFHAPSEVCFEKAFVGERREATLPIWNSGKVAIQVGVRVLPDEDAECDAEDGSSVSTRLGEEAEEEETEKEGDRNQKKREIRPTLVIQPSSLRLDPGEWRVFQLSVQVSSSGIQEFRLAVEALRVSHPPSSPMQSFESIEEGLEVEKKTQSKRKFPWLASSRQWVGTRQASSCVVPVRGEWSFICWRFELRDDSLKGDEKWKCLPPFLDLGEAHCGLARSATFRMSNLSDVSVLVCFGASSVRASKLSSPNFACLDSGSNWGASSQRDAAEVLRKNNDRKEEEDASEEAGSGDESSEEESSVEAGAMRSRLATPSNIGALRFLKNLSCLTSQHTAPSSSRSTSVRSILLTDITPRMFLQSPRCLRCLAILPESRKSLYTDGRGGLVDLRCEHHPFEGRRQTAFSSQGDSEQRLPFRQRELNRASLKSLESNADAREEGREQSPRRLRNLRLADDRRSVEANGLLSASRVTASINPSAAVVPPHGSVSFTVELQSHAFLPEKGFAHRLHGRALSALASCQVFAEAEALMNDNTKQDSPSRNKVKTDTSAARPPRHCFKNSPKPVVPLLSDSVKPRRDRPLPDCLFNSKIEDTQLSQVLRRVQKRLDAKVKAAETTGSSPTHRVPKSARNQTKSAMEARRFLKMQKSAPLLCEGCRALEAQAERDCLPSECRPHKRQIENGLGEDGGCAVSVQCTFLRPVLLVAPSKVSFGKTATNRRSAAMNVTLKNASLGGGALAFRVQAEAPFSCSPERGIISCGDTVLLCITFLPRQKLNFRFRLRVWYGPREAHCESVWLEGTGVDADQLEEKLDRFQ